MNLHRLLLERAAAGRPLRVGLVGAGKFGSMYLAQAKHTPGIHVTGIADLAPDRARASLAPRYRLASVSNTNAIHWERFRADWALDRLFHANFPSHQVGRLKPDAGYFAHVLAALELPAERVLFVDDNRVNVEAAAAMGIVARHVTGFAGLRDTLAALGVTAAEPSIPD